MHHRSVYLRGLKDADLSTADRERILIRQEDRCFYCNKLIEGRKYVLDHFVPRHAGGSHYPYNRVAAHPQCDGEKAGRMPTTAERVKLARQLINFI